MREASSNDELENTTFSTALRGYDRDEVDAFVRNVAQEMRDLHQGRTQNLYESLGEEMGALLQHARDSADDMTRKAQEQAAATRSEADADARRIREEAKATASEIQKRAEQKAAETRAEAEREASTRIAEATEKVARLEKTEGAARIRISTLHEELASITNDLQHLEIHENAQEATRPEAGKNASPSPVAEATKEGSAKPSEVDEQERQTMRLKSEQERAIR
jgi:DivIVA domain-containing protein